MSIINLSDRRPPVVYTVDIAHFWDDRLEVFVHDLSDDDRSKASVADALRRAATMFGDETPSLEAAIAEFKQKLPGWWYSVCDCQVSCDASCAPTVESPHIALIERNSAFDSGFHADLPQPSTLAEALRDVMDQALAALSTEEQVDGDSSREADQ